MQQVDEHKCHELDSSEQYALLKDVIKEFDGDEKNLIQILHMTQAIFGCLSLDVQQFIAREMDIPISRVSGVISFYSFFSTQPKGKYKIQVCLGTACYVRGGKKIVDKLKDILNLDVGMTTEDGKFSLEVMRCIGACGLAPAISINGTVYKRVNPNKIKEILESYE